MSNRFVERANTNISVTATIGDINVTKWGGTTVSPANVKADGIDPARVVPEVGAILQAVNTETGLLDRARITPAGVAPTTSDPALVVGISPVAPVGIAYANTPAIDAFARLRVSQPLSIFDSNLQYDTDPLFWSSYTVSGGAITYVTTQSVADLSVTNTIGSRTLRQSYQYAVYQPGKSHLVVFTANIGAAVAGIRKAIGYFDDNNGVFFEQNAAGVLNVALRSAAGGTTYIPQASWNVDPLNGSGPSGITLNVGDSNIFWIDLEWLGVGRVRFGIFSPQGIPVVCHQLENANANPSTYMRTATLPVRYDIECTGAAPSGATLRQICATVISEGGGESPQAFDFGVPFTASAIAVAAGSRTGIFSIRPAATFGGQTNRVTIVPQSVEIIVTGNNPVVWELIYNATFGGAPVWTAANATYSATEYAIDGGTMTGGIVIASGFAINGAGTNARVTSTTPLAFRYPLALDWQGLNPKTITLAASGLGGNASVRANINWGEYR